MMMKLRVMPPFENSLRRLPSRESSDIEDEIRIESEIYEIPKQTVKESVNFQVNSQDWQQTLKKLVKENKQKDEEIKILRKQLLEDQSLQDQLQHDMDDETKHKKIRELAKKIKRLTVSFEREKSRNVSLEAGLNSNTPIKIKMQKPIADQQITELGSELRALRDKHGLVPVSN
jgi:predicted RNase H-like nuclease (RuvC/YqgF family)